MHNVRTCIIIFCLLFFSTSAISYTKLFEPQVPDSLNINISWKYLKQYSDFINIISSNPRSPISSKYKKKFKSKIYYLDSNKILKIFPATVKISGDWQDHINSKKKISSLRINLKKDNIGNIVKFRLLLQGTRDFETEIFWSTLLELLGYPTLYQKIVNVSINGLPSENMLFQEIPTKEFLERFSMREAPILEKDERHFWKNLFIAYEHCSRLIDLADVSVQNECVKLEQSKLDDVKINWKIDNKSFLKNNKSLKIGLHSLLSNKNTTTNFKNFFDLNKAFASHGLHEINQKLIFDPIYKQYVPLYYDGDIHSGLFISACKNNKPILNTKHKNLENNLYKLNQLILIRTGKKLKKSFLCSAKKILANKNNYLNISNLVNNIDFQYKNLDYKNNYFPKIYFNRDLNSFKICSDEINCSKITIETIIESVSGDYIFNHKGKSFFPEISGKLVSKTFIKKIIVTDNENQIFNIKEDEIYYINLKNFTKNIDLNFLGKNSKALIYNSNFSKSNIKLHFTKNYENIENGFDENLLTGCLTIIDSVFDNITIKSDGGNCEDTVNIIRSVGSIKKIDVLNSPSDAVDFDFSKISVKDVYIEKAQNDCLDLSSGNYLIKNLYTKNCLDKGLSIGEKSSTKVTNFYPSNNFLDFAVKDSSEFYLENFSTNKKNDALCGSLYRKKQEFDGANFFYSKIEFPCLVKKDKFSKINFYASKK
tara:strand:+ start:878 stop:3004 length:2127 start_codon:yes stop_codon:yes gene_type:complete